MIAFTPFTLQWTSWTAIASLSLWLATAVISVITWRRSGYRRTIGFLEAARLVTLSVVALLLNQPEWVEQYKREGKPKVAVLVDRSHSMETADISSPGATSRRELLKRSEIAEPLLREELWQPLRERFDVLVQPICSTEGDPGTNLFKPLSDVVESASDLVGVVVVSDGDWNEGPSPAKAANQLRMKDVRVVSIPIGSPLRLPDIELKAISAPSIGIVGKELRVPFVIDSSLPQEFTATVTLKSSGGEESSVDVRVAANARTDGAINWRPAVVGDYQLTVSLPLQAKETILDNNEATAPISIREEQIKVLIVETHPRWEYRYLRNALSRDPGVEVSCLLFQTGLSKFGGGNKDYIKEFPATKELLSEYDVVFLGDVGVDPEQLTEEQCDWLAGLVEHQASGLVFMPGFQGRQTSLLGTKLNSLYPVVLDESQPYGIGSNVIGQVELTEPGRKSLLTRLGASEDESSSVWEMLPGFNWCAPVLRAKKGAEVLGVHQSVENEFGRLPLLASQTFGSGKVLFMGVDGAWRWRFGVEDKYHYRFWGQVVRWMAYQRNMAEGATMRLFHTPDAPVIRQTVAMQANVLGADGAPLVEGDVFVNLVAPSGAPTTVRMTSTGDQWGAYEGSFEPAEAGEYQATLQCRQTGETLDTKIFVQDAPVEVVGMPARPEVLEELARITDGSVLQPSQVTEVVNYFSDLPEPPLSTRRLQMWSHPITIAVVVAALTAFWVARKMAGLV